MAFSWFYRLVWKFLPIPHHHIVYSISRCYLWAPVNCSFQKIGEFSTYQKLVGDYTIYITLALSPSGSIKRQEVKMHGTVLLTAATEAGGRKNAQIYTGTIDRANKISSGR
jgi:hypothetical protein